MPSTTNLNRALENLALTPADLPSLAEARALWAAMRVEYGFKPTGDTDLLAEGANVKIAKNIVRTWTLTLVPADLSLRWNVCTWATRQCREACVMWTAGRQYDSVRRGRLVRTAFLAQHPAAFLAILTDEVRRRNARGVEWGMRLNVASDLRWENIAPWLFDGGLVRAYDYTKAPARPNVPANYRITYSHSERWTDADVLARIAAGENVAMVFDRPKHDLPATYLGVPVIDGDLTDFRYADPIGVIVGLAAKGAAKRMDAGGFVAEAGEVPVLLGRKAA
jgi:hypothetical protein